MRNYKNQLDLLQSEEERYILEKAIEYQQKLNLENSGDGWNDTTDAFRHAWGSAYLALKYGDTIANLGTTGHEIFETNQPVSEKNMDQWNNSIGREIAKNIRKEYGDVEKSFQWSHIEDLIANEALKKINESKLITSTSDSRVNESGPLFKLNATKNSVQSRLDYYKQRIYESMLKNNSDDNTQKPALTGQMLKDMLSEQKQKLTDFAQNTYMKSDAINKRFTGDIPDDYENPHVENNKIFTKEEIESMSEEEKDKNAEAIKYQQKTIGIPTNEQAAKTAAREGSGLVHVSGYTTGEGRKVEDYYRARPGK